MEIRALCTRSAECFPTLHTIFPILRKTQLHRPNYWFVRRERSWHWNILVYFFYLANFKTSEEFFFDIPVCESRQRTRRGLDLLIHFHRCGVLIFNAGSQLLSSARGVTVLNSILASTQYWDTPPLKNTSVAMSQHQPPAPESDSASLSAPSQSNVSETLDGGKTKSNESSSSKTKNLKAKSFPSYILFTKIKTFIRSLMINTA